MTKPVLLDIGCRQGGATRGYQNAGFYVIGVDIEPQPRYIGDDFIQVDGLAVLRSLVRDRQRGDRPAVLGVVISAVHTSWPCQSYGNTQRIMDSQFPRLLEPGRELLQATGLPYVQENVPGAPLVDPIQLCGPMFGLNTYRHRLFESNIPLTEPKHPAHRIQQIKMGRPVAEGDFYQAVGNFSNVPYARADMGVPWMTREGIRECIPPAYTEYVGHQLMAHVLGVAV